MGPMSVNLSGGFGGGRGGHTGPVRIGNTEIRPLGGAPGCLAMILFSIVASILLTVLLNLIF